MHGKSVHVLAVICVAGSQKFLESVPVSNIRYKRHRYRTTLLSLRMSCRYVHYDVNFNFPPLGRPVLLPGRLSQPHQLPAGVSGAAQPLLATLRPGVGGGRSPHRPNHPGVSKPPGLRLAVYCGGRQPAPPPVTSGGPALSPGL